MPTACPRYLSLLAAAGLVAVAAAGCSAPNDANDPETGTTATAAASADGLGAAPATEETRPSGTDGGSNTGGGSNGNSGGSTGGGTGNNADTGPRIVYFRVKQQPSCPRGTTLNTYPGQPLVIEWKVAGTSQADLAVDGPGLYRSYGAEGTETFTFGCGGAPGSTVRHTYTLTPKGGHAKTISASATVNEIAQVDNPTEAPAPGP